jgi:hypothetical protein
LELDAPADQLFPRRLEQAGAMKAEKASLNGQGTYFPGSDRLMPSEP